MRNKTNKTLFGIGVTTAAVALAVSLVTAQAGAGGNKRRDPQVGQQGRAGGGPVGRGGRFGPQGPGGRFGGAGLAGLDLTEEQRTKVGELQRLAREQAAPIDEELRTTERALHKELFADARDAGKIAGLSAKAASLQKQLGELRLKSTTAVADVLTAEQRATVREREGRGGGRGRGPGRFGGRPGSYNW